MVQTNFLATIEPLYFSSEERGGDSPSPKYEKVVYGELVIRKTRAFVEQNSASQSLI